MNDTDLHEQILAGAISHVATNDSKWKKEGYNFLYQCPGCRKVAYVITDMENEILRCHNCEYEGHRRMWNVTGNCPCLDPQWKQFKGHVICDSCGQIVYGKDTKLFFIEDIEMPKTAEQKIIVEATIGFDEKNHPKITVSLNDPHGEFRISLSLGEAVTLGNQLIEIANLTGVRS
jgi:hypothetical protein